MTKRQRQCQDRFNTIKLRSIYNLRVLHIIDDSKSKHAQSLHLSKKINFPQSAYMYKVNQREKWSSSSVAAAELAHQHRIFAEGLEALGIGNDTKLLLRVSDGLRSQELTLAFPEQQQHVDDVVLVDAVADIVLEAPFHRVHAEGRGHGQQLECVFVELEDAPTPVYVVENRLEEDGSETNAVRLPREIHVAGVIRLGTAPSYGFAEVRAARLD